MSNDFDFEKIARSKGFKAYDVQGNTCTLTGEPFANWGFKAFAADAGSVKTGEAYSVKALFLSKTVTLADFLPPDEVDKFNAVYPKIDNVYQDGREGATAKLKTKKIKGYEAIMSILFYNAK